MDPTDIFAAIYLDPIAKAIIASLLPPLRWNQIKWGKKGSPVHVLLGWGSAFERDVRGFLCHETSPRCGNVINKYIKILKVFLSTDSPLQKQSLPQQSCGIWLRQHSLGAIECWWSWGKRNIVLNALYEWWLPLKGLVLACGAVMMPWRWELKQYLRWDFFACIRKHTSWWS